MKSKYSYLFGNIKLFIIASFIPKALDLCMVSLYTRCLTDADYGIADLLANTVQLIMPVLTLQIQDAVLRDAMDERYQKKDVLGVGVRIACSGGIILLGKDFENPWGKTTPKGQIKMMSQLLDSAVFPGVQGGPLEHVIAAKAVAFGEALEPEYKVYQAQVKKNAAVMAQAFIDKGYKIISGGTDNHSMLIDLRTKFPDLTGKVAEKALVAADITVNKNMVPFDSRSAFQTSGIRVGTPAITTRGAKEAMMGEIVELIDTVLSAPECDKTIAAVREKVNSIMKEYPLFAW